MTLPPHILVDAFTSLLDDAHLPTKQSYGTNCRITETIMTPDI